MQILKYVLFLGKIISIYEYIISRDFLEGKMDKAFVQTLKDRIDIVQVVGEYVHLERKGRGYWACCPFHHEKTPSFQVSQDQQFYHCFGCHKSGDVIVFVQEMEQISFMEAIEKLAKRAGLEVPKSNDNGEFEVRKKKET